MKNRATGFLKQIMQVLASIARSKSMALKSKTRDLQTRLIIYSLVRDKKVLIRPISAKLHHSKLHPASSTEDSEVETDQIKPLFMHRNVAKSENMPAVTKDLTYQTKVTDDDTYELYKKDGKVYEEEEVVEKVEDQENEEDEETGNEIGVEDDIDRVAELFIRRIHRQIQMQKQSIERYDQEEMLCSD